MFSHDPIPERYQNGAKEIAQAIQKLDNVLISAHVNPDGDALGSVAATGWILKQLGRNFAIYSCTGIPSYLQFLELPGPVYTELRDIPFEVSSAIYLDCSEAHRLGHELSHCYDKWPTVNIDHHLVDRGLGSLANFIMPDTAATAQLISYVAMSMDISLTGKLAQSISLGLMTDTGGFCHGNTTADVFALCALLVHQGCNINELREQLHNSWSVEKLHLWGKLLASLKLYDDGQIAFCPVTQEELKASGCSAEDLEGLVEWFRKIRGVKVAAMMREEDEHKCKFSLRSFGPVNVRSMAAELGGGGHQNAAGGVVHKPIEQAVSVLLHAISRETGQEDS